MTYDLDLIFRALADPTRRTILSILTKGERSVGELAQSFKNMSLAAVSKHLQVLARARLILRRRDGSYTHMRLEPQALKSAEEWISHYEQFWDGTLDSLKHFIEGETP